MGGKGAELVMWVVRGQSWSYKVRRGRSIGRSRADHIRCGKGWS